MSNDPFFDDTDQVLLCAGALVAAVNTLGLRDTFKTAQPTVWQEGRQLLQAGNVRGGYHLLLSAIAETPNGPHLLITALIEYLASTE